MNLSFVNGLDPVDDSRLRIVLSTVRRSADVRRTRDNRGLVKFKEKLLLPKEELGAINGLEWRNLSRVVYTGGYIEP